MSRPNSGPIGRDPLFRLLAWNWLAGAVIAVLLAGAVLAFDVAHLRSLIAGSSEPVVPVLLLVFGFLITMCSVTMGTAIMGLGAEPPSGADSGRRSRAEDFGEFARVAVAARPRR